MNTLRFFLPRPRFWWFAIAGLLTVVLAAPGSARAALVLNFNQIGGGATNTGDQFSVTVYGQADGTVSIGAHNVIVGVHQALFVFENSGPIASSISRIYFQDGTLLEIPAGGIFNNDTNFTVEAKPDDLAGGQSLSPNFITTNQFSADSSGNPNNNGVSSSLKPVGILFDLGKDASGNNYKYNDVLAALQMGFDSPEDVWKQDGTRLNDTAPLGLRIGIHVSAIGDANGSNNSAQFISGDPGVQPVPEPSTITMALMALIPMGVMGLRRLQRRGEAGLG